MANFAIVTIHLKPLANEDSVNHTVVCYNIYTTKKNRKPRFQFITENSSHLTSHPYIGRTFIFVSREFWDKKNLGNQIVKACLRDFFGKLISVKLVIMYKRVSVDLNAEEESSFVVRTSSENAII